MKKQIFFVLLLIAFIVSEVFAAPPDTLQITQARLGNADYHSPAVMGNILWTDWNDDEVSSPKLCVNSLLYMVPIMFFREKSGTSR